MLSSLESLLANPSTQYTKSVIQAGLRTPVGETVTWIVVEDSDDVDVYQPLFKEDSVRILTSAYNVDGQEQKGCSFLEKIVEEILTEEDNPSILGIRDADYTRYEVPVHVFPQNVFHTDHRDVEMMLLSSDSVQTDLEAWNPLFLSKLEEGKMVTRKLGYMRICNHLYSLGCNFKHKVKLSKLWDSRNHSVLSNWEQVLMDLFLTNCGNNENLEEPFTDEKFNAVVEEKGLEQESHWNVAQGHDTIRLLQYMMVKNEYCEKAIMKRITQAYSFTDFQTTNLYRNLKTWEESSATSILN